MNNSKYEDMMDILKNHPTCDGSHMLIRFFRLLGETNFNQIYEGYFSSDEGFSVSFYQFHKSMRQTDFFDHNVGLVGELDMLFWNFINMSDIPYKRMGSLYRLDKEGFLS